METEKRLWRSVIIGAVCLGLASITQPASHYLRYIGSAAENWISVLGAILLLVGAIAFIRSHLLARRLRRERGLSERLPQTGAAAASNMRRGNALAAIFIGIVGVSIVVGLLWLQFNACDPLLRLSIELAFSFSLPFLLLLLVVGTWRHRFDEGKRNRHRK